jgi:hypothetical protein
MKNTLVAFRAQSLTNVETAELISRHLTDFEKLDKGVITDPHVINYETLLKDDLSLLRKALMQIQRNAETDKIAEMDKARDKAVTTLRKALSLAEETDDTDLQEQCHAVGILFDKYKGTEVLNYEAESMNIDNWLADLQSPAYAKSVVSLGLTVYVDRLKTANDAFKSLFSNRQFTTSFVESYNTKMVREQLITNYREFTLYILSMSNATNGDQYLKILALLNNGRQYYADIIARRNGRKAATGDTTTEPETSAMI